MALSKTAVLGWLLILLYSSIGDASNLHAQPRPATGERIVNSADFPGSLVPIACQATRYPDVCGLSMSRDSRSATANSTDLVRMGIELASIEARGSYELVEALLGTSELLQLNIDTRSAALVCEEALTYGVTTLETSKDSLLGVSPIQDIQAWLSAALQFQYDCFSAFADVQNPPSAVETILPQVNSTMQHISNALCMTNALAVYGSGASAWLPPLETRPANLTSVFRDVNPEWISQSDSCLLQQPVSNLTPNVTVSLDGLSNYSSVQEAVDNAPTYSNQRYIVYIKEGTYTEIVRVHQNKTYIAFIGDGADKTILTGSRNASPGITTFQTASVVVVGKGFVARNIAFQNTAGPNMSQAVAARVDSDMSAFQDCIFDGYQDTLYAHTGRQFYYNCTVLGTVDYIFGNSAAIFQNCQLVVRLNRPGATTSVVTAQGRTDPGQATGLVFHNCSVTGTPEYMQAVAGSNGNLRGYLGRPWKLFSRTVFVNTYIDSLIDPEGWSIWQQDFALDSLLYGEYESWGPGAPANATSRVPWSNQLTQDEAQHLSVEKFIQGNWWLPCTEVPFGTS